MKLLATLLCFWLLPLALFAQQPYIRSLGIADGLPTPTIYNLKCSRSGHIWMGTELGLARYNGQRFVLYPSKETRSFAVSDIIEDANGGIWCRNFSNQVLYLHNDTLKVEPNIAALLDSFPSLNEFKMFGNKLWFTTSSALACYDLSKKSCEVVAVSNTPSTFSVSKVQGNEVTLVKNDFDIASTLASRTSKWNVKATEADIFRENFTTRYYENKIYILGKGAKERTLYEMKNSGIEKSFDLSFIREKTILFHTEALKDGLWICTNNGIYPLSAPYQPLLLGKRVSCIVEDFQGNYWMSTLDDGLYCMPNKNIEWFYQDEQVSNLSKLGTTLDGDILAGTPSGEIHQIGTTGKKKITYVSATKGDISHIKQDPVTKFIIATTGVFKEGNPLPVVNLVLGKDLAIAHDLQQMYVAYSDIVVRSEIPKTGFNAKYIEDFGEEKYKYYLRSVRGRAILYQHSHQRFWVAYADELYYYDSKGNGKPLRTKEGKPITAISMSDDMHGGVWVGTTTLGLLRIEDTSIVVQYNKANGLSSDNCRQVAVKRNGDAVVQTPMGLDMVTLGGNKRPIDLLSTLGIGKINIRSLVIDQQDKLYIATGNGILSTKLPNLGEEKQKSKIALELLHSADGQKIDVKQPIAFEDANLTFKFEAVDFRLPRNARWQYRMVGINEDWKYLPIESSELNFLGMSAGNYEFQLKIEGQQGQPQRIAFSVLNPFWKRWWFIALVLLAALSSIYLSFKFFLGRAQKRQSLKHQLSLSQITALRAQMNPHFLYNALNTVSGYIYANRKSEAGNYLSSFSELTRHILDMSGKESVTLHEELNALRLYLTLESGRLEGQGFEYDIVVAEDIDPHMTKLPPLLLQPYIENSVKHGLIHRFGDKRLSIGFRQNMNGTLIIEIDDNGIGRAASAAINEKRGKKTAGFSTAANKERIALLNQFRKKPIHLQIVDKHDPNTGEALGTNIIIEIPVE